MKIDILSMDMMSAEIFENRMAFPFFSYHPLVKIVKLSGLMPI